MIAEIINKIGSMVTRVNQTSTQTVNQTDPKYPYGFNVNPLKYKGEQMRFFPGISIKEDGMKQDNNNESDEHMPQHYRVGEDIDVEDGQAEEFWILNILPAIITDAFGYEEVSPSARFPQETDEAYEERMLFAMDVTRGDMQDLEARIDLFLAEMN